jgi:hypothetical protein
MAAPFAQTRSTLRIIDTLQHFAGGAGCSERSEDTAALQHLRLLAQSHNTAAAAVMRIIKDSAQGSSGAAHRLQLAVMP